MPDESPTDESSSDDQSPDGSSAPKRARASLESTFSVLAGNDGLQKRFELHTNLFIPRSEFFRAARSAAWNTDPLKPTTLDDDPEVLENYVHYVYFGDLNPHPYNSDDRPNLIDSDHLDALSKMWLLADKLIDLETANLIMNEIRGYCTKMCNLAENSSFNLVYDSTTSDSSLRAAMCDLVIYNGDDRFFETRDPSEFHIDFLRDIAVGFLRIKEGNMRSSKTFMDVFGEFSRMPCSSRYHLHDSEYTPSVN